MAGSGKGEAAEAGDPVRVAEQASCCRLWYRSSGSYVAQAPSSPSVSPSSSGCILWCRMAVQPLPLRLHPILCVREARGRGWVLFERAGSFLTAVHSYPLSRMWF